MSIRYPGGLITKTPVTPSGPTGTNTAPGVWTIEQALEYQKAGNWPSSAGTIDSNFEYVTMLLPGNGTNGAQNNTFLDSSANNFTITRNGNTTQGTFSPYGDNWSNYFDGTGDYLSVPNNAALQMGTGDYTFELWVNFGSHANDYRILTKGFYNQAGGMDWFEDTGKLYIYSNGNFLLQSDYNSLQNSQWTHIALTRSGTTVKLFINGNLDKTVTGNSDNLNNSGTLYIATYDGTQSYVKGYISNFRIVKGTAVYTAAFTPPTSPLTAISGTSLLTCQSNRFIDNSTNAFTITVNGNTSVQRFSPFSPTASYAAGTIGGSGYFDGSGDYLTVPSSAAFNFSNQDFTIECYIRRTGNGSLANYLISRNEGNNFLFRIDRGPTPQRLEFYFQTSSGIVQPILYNFNYDSFLNTWVHLAVVRTGSVFSLYVNGNLVSSGNNSNPVVDSNDPLTVAGGLASGDYFNGYISNLRIVKGTAVYTSNFTPPTAPLTAITNTSLLLNFTNGGIIDNAMMNDLETVGNAQISTAVSKFGGGSMAFDGTGDRLVGVNTPNLNFGSGPWTIEFWIYATDQALGPIVNQCSQSASAGWGVWAYNGSTGTSRRLTVFLNGANFSLTTAADAWASNTWTHIAVVKSGTNLTVYANGNSVATSSSAPSSITDTTAPPMIGATVSGVNWGVSYDFNGYIDDLRITKGVARYTANFTPPTAAFPTR